MGLNSTRKILSKQDHQLIHVQPSEFVVHHKVACPLFRPGILPFLAFSYIFKYYSRNMDLHINVEINSSQRV